MTNKIFSIIIPVYDDLAELKGLIPKILRQSFNLNEVEIIVVENGNTKSVEEYCSSIQEVIYISESQHLGSPYSCRNRGIEKAKGKYLIFLDSTCHPIPTWLSAIHKRIDNSDAEMIAGNVSFRFRKEEPTIAELIDSKINIKMEESVKLKGVAKTANLIVKAEIFEEVGLFDEGVRSGGDIDWTKKAVESGFKLIFDQDSEVKKAARTYGELMKKQLRVGFGKSRVERKSNYLIQLLTAIFRTIKPPKSTITKSISSQTDQFSHIQIYFVFYTLNLAQQLGYLLGSFRIKKK